MRRIVEMINGGSSAGAETPSVPDVEAIKQWLGIASEEP
jgi:hypothetical protein